MSNSRDDRFHNSYGKARRSPPGADFQSNDLFQTRQGGRPVLPPISSAFPISHSPGLLFLITVFSCNALNLIAHAFSS
jgi:homeobox protein YOX1/YHP1